MYLYQIQLPCSAKQYWLWAIPWHKWAIEKNPLSYEESIVCVYQLGLLLWASHGQANGCSSATRTQKLRKLTQTCAHCLFQIGSAIMKYNVLLWNHFFQQSTHMGIDGTIAMPKHVYITGVKCFVYILKLSSVPSTIQFRTRCGINYLHMGW